MAEGIGGLHVGADMIWPISITMKALTSNNQEEIKNCIQVLLKTHGETGFMHESFHKDDERNLQGNGLLGPIPYLENYYGKHLMKILNYYQN